MVGGTGINPDEDALGVDCSVACESVMAQTAFKNDGRKSNQRGLALRAALRRAIPNNLCTMN